MTVRVKVVVAERFCWVSVPVSVRVYFPAGDVEDVPALVPHAVIPKPKTARRSTAPKKARRRRAPGKPIRSSPASMAPGR